MSAGRSIPPGGKQGIAMQPALRSYLVTALIAVVAAAVYWKSLSIPAGLYDPLGAGTMPRIVCGGIILFCIISVVHSRFRAVSPKAKTKSSTVGIQAHDRPWLAASTFALMVLLAATILYRVSYEITTSVFLFVGILAIRRFKPAVVPMAAVLSIMIGVGVAYLFGHVFSVDLP
jgi:hypothetical protein